MKTEKNIFQTSVREILMSWSDKLQSLSYQLQALSHLIFRRLSNKINPGNRIQVKLTCLREDAYKWWEPVVKSSAKRWRLLGLDPAQDRAEFQI